MCTIAEGRESHSRLYVFSLSCLCSLAQVSLEELQSDAEELFTIVVHDPEFEGIMADIDHHQAKDAVYEAVQVLHTAPEPHQNTELIEHVDISAEVHIQYMCMHV